MTWIDNWARAILKNENSWLLVKFLIRDHRIKECAFEFYLINCLCLYIFTSVNFTSFVVLWCLLAEYTVSEFYRNNSSISQVVAFTSACFHEAAYRLSSSRRSCRESKLHKIISKEHVVHHASCHSDTLVDVPVRSDPVYIDYEAKWPQYTTLPKTNRQRKQLILLRPVAQLYGQVRTDWNQCFEIDCSLSHPAGHKPFTCSHSVLRNTWLNIHAVRWMRFSARLSVLVFTTSRNLTWSLFNSTPFISCVSAARMAVKLESA